MEKEIKVYARTPDGDLAALRAQVAALEAERVRLTGYLERIREYERNEDEQAREYGVLEPDKVGYCFSLADAALASAPAAPDAVAKDGRLRELITTYLNMPPSEARVDARDTLVRYLQASSALDAADGVTHPRETLARQHVVGARENNKHLQDQIERDVAGMLALAPDERRRVIEPMIAFLSGVNELSDDQVAHLGTLRILHALSAADGGHVAPSTAYYTVRAVRREDDGDWEVIDGHGNSAGLFPTSAYAELMVRAIERCAPDAADGADTHEP